MMMEPSTEFDDLKRSISKLFEDKIGFAREIIAINQANEHTSPEFAALNIDDGTGSEANVCALDQSTIVKQINRLIAHDNVTILPHHSLNWIVIGKIKGKLHVYAVKKGGVNFLDENDKDVIEDMYNEQFEDPLSKIEFNPTCPRPSKIENRFCFTVAYALCLAKGQDMKTFFERTLGEGEDTSMIRALIDETIKHNKIPAAINAVNAN